MLSWLVVVQAMLFVVEASKHNVFKKHLIDTLAYFPSSRIVSFAVKANHFTFDYRNILHLTTNQNEGFGRDSVPGVWMDYDRLYIVEAINKDPDLRFYSKRLKENTWYLVTIMNMQVGHKSMCFVYLDDEKIASAEKRFPDSFKDVSVYVSDPWYKPFDGEIRNLIISGPGMNTELDKSSTIFSLSVLFLRVSRLRKNLKHITRLPRLPSIYVVSFSFIPKSFLAGENSVLMLTENLPYKEAKPIVTVWLDYDKLVFARPVKADQHFAVTSKPIVKNRWSDVRILTLMVGDKYIFEVYVNGEKITSVKDSGKDHGDRSVDVFLPADWKQAADGYVKDFVISSPGYFHCNSGRINKKAKC